MSGRINERRLCYDALTTSIVGRIAMSTVKEEIRKMLDQLPDDVSFEDIQYHIYVRQKIERGLADVAEGRVMSQEELERRMARWLGEE